MDLSKPLAGTVLIHTPRPATWEVTYLPSTTTAVHMCMCQHSLPGQAHTHVHRQLSRVLCWLSKAVRSGDHGLPPGFPTASMCALSYHLLHCTLVVPPAAPGKRQGLLAPSGEVTFHMNPEIAIWGRCMWKFSPQFVFYELNLALIQCPQDS